MNGKTIVQELLDRKADAEALAVDIRSVAVELTSLADSLESGSGWPQKIHATGMGERVRKLMTRYNALKQDIDFLREAISRNIRKG